MRVDKVRKVIEPPESRENDDNGKVITAGNREKSCGKSHVRKVIRGKSSAASPGKVIREKSYGKSNPGVVIMCGPGIVIRDAGSGEISLE